MPERTNQHGIPQELYKDDWSMWLLNSASEQESPPKNKVTSTSYNKADIINENPTHATCFYTLDDMKSWFGMRMQEAGAIHWRPDSEQSVKNNASRLLPPIISPQHPITLGSPAMCKWFTEDEQLDLTRRLAQATHRVKIQAPFRRRNDQSYIASRRASVEFGTETCTDFIEAHGA